MLIHDHLKSFFTATTELQHDEYIVFMRDAESAAVVCTRVSIDIDLVYSVDRMFTVMFEPMNERDEVVGNNEINITIIENGRITFPL